MFKHLIPLKWFLLSMLGLIWGMAFMGVEMALKGFNPLTIAAFRIVIAGLTLNCLAFFMGYKLPSIKQKHGKKILLHCLGMGILSNLIPFSLLSWSQIHVSSGYAGIAMAVVPLIILPLSHYFIPNMKMTFTKIVGFIIGFLGVIILIGPSTIFSSENDSMILAKFTCILASCSYALGSIVTRLTPQINLISFSACSLLIASVLIIPLALFFEGIPKFSNWISVFGILYLGFFPTALATILLVFLIREAGPPFLGLVNYQVPVWAVLIGYFLLNENLPSSFVLALFVILFGLFISEFLNKKTAKD